MRIELTTFALLARRSNQLSYETRCKFLKDLEVTYPDGEIGVTQDRFEIDDKLLQKYRTLYKDNGKKETYVDGFNTVKLVFTGDDVLAAMEDINFDKATGWDYLSGEVFKLIRKYKTDNPRVYTEFCVNMAKFYNE